MLAKDQNKKNDPKIMTDSPVLDLNNSAIKSLIKKGKVNGFVTLDELNAALPPGEYTSEQIEDIHSAINEMGFNIVDQQEETTTEDNEDRTAGNLSDDEGARSDDPVRMYLREMGSVELLSREGEISIAKRIEAYLLTINKTINVAIMGCAVNGPGEASHADIGVAGGKGEAILFRHGKIIKKIKESEVYDALIEEINNFDDTKNEGEHN